MSNRSRSLTLFGLSTVALALACLLAPRTSSAAAMDEISTANESGKVVFLVLTDAAGKNLAAAREAARKAQAQTPDSTIVELNRSDASQAAAVKKYRVAAAPVPLIMVIGQNGVAAGASLVKKGAVARLTKLVPTPAKSEYLKVLEQRQTAVVVFSHAKMPNQSPLFENISTVVKETKGKVTPVLVDVTDRREAKFLAEWKIDPKSSEPTVVVMNTKGLTLGKMTGAPTAEQIIETTKKRPCCGDPSCKGCN